MARCGPRYENTRCGEQCLDRMTGRPTTKRNGGPNIRRDPMLSIRDGGERGRDRAPVNIVSPQELRPAETGTTATTGTIDNMVVGNSPVQSNLCTAQFALSVVMGNKVTKTVFKELTVRTNSAARILPIQLRKPRSTSLHVHAAFLDSAPTTSSVLLHVHRDCAD